MLISKPNRKKHGYTQHLNAPPDKVFPLLCPVLEAEWAPGWMPESVYTESGVCEQECIFITPPGIPSEVENAIWIVSNHDLKNWIVEMYKVVPHHSISKLVISLSGEHNNRTAAHISYEITAIGMAGNEFLEEFTKDWYEKFMSDWENAMNHYLDTGKMIA
ncbi:MAG: hypothetical protein ABFS32_21280 [Bacteroidota bacterium]